MPINLTNPELTELRPRIVVFGVGGAGGNAVNNMIDAELQGVEFVAANTDAQALTKSRTANQIQLGAGLTQGLGAGAQPEVGRGAAEEAVDHIKQHLEGCHMCFITAGMGGGTGTGAAPVIARMAREAGILTVGVVTKPFQFEGKRRMAIADAGVRELQANVDTLIVIPNQNLFRVANEKTTFADAFKIADEVLHSGVRSITDLMVEPGLINLDFADVRTVMHEMGKAMMGTGEAEGEERARKAAQDAIANPLLEDMSLKTARGVLINVTGGMDLTLHEVDEAASLIREEVDEDANIIIGSILDPELDGRMRVSVVATGIDMAEVAQGMPVQGFTPRVVATGSIPAAAPRVEAPRPQPQVSFSTRSSGGAATAMAVQHEPEAEHEVETGAIETPRAVIDDVAEAEIFREPAPEAFDAPKAAPVAVETVRPSAGTAGASGVAKPKFDFRDDIPTFPTRTREAAFMPQRPQTAATVDRAQPEPEPQHSQPAAEPKSSAKRLIDRLTGRGRADAAKAEPAKRPLFPNRTEAEIERARREPTMPGLDLGEPEPKKPSRVEDDLDIPAFLRRQAN